MDLFKVLLLDEANDILKKRVPLSVNSSLIKNSKALNKIISENYYAKTSVPHFKRSSVDGYGVKARSTVGASNSNEIFLKRLGEVKMGERAEFKNFEEDNCVYIPTGAMIPEDCDAVVMIEYTEKLDDNSILINKPVAVGENVVHIGEDIEKGELILKKGTRLNPYNIGALSACGIDKVSVYKKIRVGIISTGDEVIEISAIPKDGQIRDINSSLLASMVKEIGEEVVEFGVVKDDFYLLKEAIEKAIEECDILLISGGSSVGKKDETLKVINSFDNLEILFHGIAIKPGKPTIAAKVDDKLLVGLPGHPLAAAIVFKNLVAKYIYDFKEMDETGVFLIGEFAMNYHKAIGREEFLPVTIDLDNDEIKVSPILTKSGIISSFSKAYGYIRIDRNKEGLYKGEKVKVYKL